MNDARRSGIKWVGVGALLAAIWIAALLFMNSLGKSMYGPALGMPIIPLLIGLTQLTTGRHFGELAHAWDSLAGWQRGVLGLVIVGIATAIIVGGIGVALAIFVDL